MSSAGYSLLVQGLSAEMDESVLWALFAPFGNVLSMKVRITVACEVMVDDQITVAHEITKLFEGTVVD